MLSCVEHEKSFITSGPGFGEVCHRKNMNELSQRSKEWSCSLVLSSLISHVAGIKLASKMNFIRTISTFKRNLR